METRLQLRIIILTLIVLGCGSALYKYFYLGFSFLPNKKVEVWTIESQISYTPVSDDIEISLNLPDPSNSLEVLEVKNVSPGFIFTRKDGRGIWRPDGNEESEEQDSIYLQTKIALKPDAGPGLKKDFVSTTGLFEGGLGLAADIIIENAAPNASVIDRTEAILQALNMPDNESAFILRESKFDFGSLGHMAASVLDRAGIKARPIKGLQLAEAKKNQRVDTFIEIDDDGKYYLFNLASGLQEDAQTVLLWQQNNEAMLDIQGGRDGKVNFSVLTGTMSSDSVALLTGKREESVFVDFSIYSLPIKDQNTFKLLLLIPIGALVVVVLRNLIGIVTTGTFMPILIALVFLQTSLLSGFALFLTVVSVGLVLRKYLSHLNLLLVPRISAVLVFVIIIYVAIAVTSVKLGFESGLQVTFFPMIIISWTIERMSILWEEEGPKDVLKQGGGSLFAASLIYFAMSNKYLGHLTYAFPELLLVVLAVIIMIGSYSGYRLSELRRFEPLVKGQ